MDPRTAVWTSRALLAFPWVLVPFAIWVSFDQIQLSEDFLYWAQVFSGNWSIDYLTDADYGKPTDKKNHDLQFLYGMIIAILLNFGTIAALITAFVKLSRMETKMNIDKAFNIKEDIIKRRILQILSDTNHYDLAPQVREAFLLANEEWNDKALSKFLSKPAQEQLAQERKKEIG